MYVAPTSSRFNNDGDLILIPGTINHPIFFLYIEIRQVAIKPPMLWHPLVWQNPALAQVPATSARASGECAPRVEVEALAGGTVSAFQGHHTTLDA